MPMSWLELEVNPVLEVWLEAVDFPLLVCKQVFPNQEGSQGVVYLMRRDTRPQGYASAGIRG